MGRNFDKNLPNNKYYAECSFLTSRNPLQYVSVVIHMNQKVHNISFSAKIGILFDINKNFSVFFAKNCVLCVE